MRIRIVSGAYGWHDGRRVRTMTARDGAFEVEDAEAAKLIAAGIAVSSEFGVRSSELAAAEPRQSGERRVESGDDVAGGDGVASLHGAAAAAAGIVTPDGGVRVPSGHLCEAEAPTEAAGETRLTEPRYGVVGDESGSGTEDGAEDNNSELRSPISELDSTVDYLTLSAAELRGLCEERGIPYKKNAGVKALAALLEADDARPLPELLADDPVL